MTIEAGTNDVVCPDDYLEDTSTVIEYHLVIRLQNQRLTTKQRGAFYKKMIEFARQIRIATLLMLPDKTLARVQLSRSSSVTGSEEIKFFEE